MAEIKLPEDNLPEFYDLNNQELYITKDKDDIEQIIKGFQKSKLFKIKKVDSEKSYKNPETNEYETCIIPKSKIQVLSGLIKKTIHAEINSITNDKDQYLIFCYDRNRNFYGSEAINIIQDAIF